ncbi:MAG: DUF1887 family protein [Zoogloeaceae bacterium]|jgi:hypothetical protein|nr:DUF1887 family protein [Zoogloeaceae bacterium]
MSSELFLPVLALAVVLAVVAFFVFSRHRQPPESTFRCARCQTETPHDKRTIKAWRQGKNRFFCRRCHEKWLRMQTNGDPQTPAVQPAAAAPPPPARAVAPLPEAPKILPTIDLFNTGHFTDPAQTCALRSWCLRRGIEARVNAEAVDTTGFYDEIAVAIGEHLALARRVLDAIRWAGREQRPSALVHLGKNSEAEVAALRGFVKKLYDASLIAGQFYDVKKKTLLIKVQSAQNAVRFFNGEWLEWFALMRLLQTAQARQLPLSCARNLHIAFADGARFELDVFALLGDAPLVIECKSGEFRPFIEKSQTLAKKLGLDSRRFILCIAGLETEKLAPLAAMHKLVFANEETLAQTLADL